MIHTLKRRLYFAVAHYFKFWAKIQLLIWRPKVIVVTGSSGKTTTMHLIQAQLGDKAHYSHFANSAYGISFDILGMQRRTLLKSEWPALFLRAPLRAFKKPYAQKLYVAEVDCDRPGEGRFLAKFLRPEAVVWLSSEQTHSVNFQSLVAAGKYKNVEDAISFEFGHIAAAAKKAAIINADNPHIKRQLQRIKAKNIQKVTMSQLKSYRVRASGTEFTTNTNVYKLASALPEISYYSVVAAELITAEYGASFDASFKGLVLPPGRSSLFSGKKETTIIDSSYNSSLEAASEMLELLGKFETKSKKWAVVGDVLEQGALEPEVHVAIAEAIHKQNIDQVVLVGPRVTRHTLPRLIELGADQTRVHGFEMPRDALTFINKNLTGGEVVLFKGARFLEGIVEHLLKNKSDAKLLCRRQAVWQKRRKQWGL